MPMQIQDSEEDPAIVERLAGGDVEAFAILVRRYARPISSYLTHRVGDRHAADDISQEVFLRAFRAISAGNFAGASSLKTWLFTIANNAMVDHFRYHARRPHSSDHAQRHDTADTSTDPARLAERAEQADLARRLVARLPEPQQQVISMKLFGQLSFAEIAEVLGCPIATARSRMRYGLMKVHEALAAESKPEVMS